MKQNIGIILNALIERKLGVKKIAAKVYPDHIHLLLEIPPKYSMSEIVGFLKGKSTLMIFKRHTNLNHRYGNRSFWYRGYFVDTVGKMQKRSKNTLRINCENKMLDQLSMKEYIDPFTESHKWVRTNYRLSW